jgi:polyisoprenoid-binding protein YceI
MLSIWLLATLAATQTPAAEKSLAFDQASAKLEFIGEYDGEPIEGRFERFSGKAVLGANALPSFRVEVDVASLNSDYADRDEVLRNSDWFDVVAHPKATYVSTAACTVQAKALLCPGTLTVRGKSASVPLQIKLAADGSMEGNASMDRRTFGVGKGEWDDMGVIGQSVQIRFRIGK